MQTYDEILNRMVQKYEEISGFAPSEQSDIMLRLRVLSGELYNTLAATEFVKKQMFASTASGDFLDKHGLDRGIKRKTARKAKGSVSFYITPVSESDIVIRKGTVVSTVGPDVLQFETDEDVVLVKGTSGVTVSATALEGGSAYNVRKNTVTVMVTPPYGVTSCTNNVSFMGGADAESDSELRERILNSYRDIPNSTNEVYYKRLAESVEGVHSASVVPRVRGVGTIDIYLCGRPDSPMNGEYINEVQKLVDKNRELNVDVEVLYSLPLEVSYTVMLSIIDGYDFESVKADITAKITDYIVSLGVGKAALLSEIGDIIYHTDGVINYSLPREFCFDIYPKPYEHCVLKQINFKQV